MAKVYPAEGLSVVQVGNRVVTQAGPIEVTEEEGRALAGCKRVRVELEEPAPRLARRRTAEPPAAPAEKE